MVGFLTENGFLNGGIFWKYELSYRVTHAIECNVNITSVELKEMLMQEWAGCLFDVLAMAQPDDRVIREKAKVPRVEAQPSHLPAQIYCRSVIYLATESLIDISDAGPTASHHFRIVRTQQISCRFTVHSRHLSYLSRSLFPSKHKRRVQLGESCNVYC